MADPKQLPATPDAAKGAEVGVPRLITHEPMPWMIALRLRCLEIARDTAARMAKDALEPEAERYLNWVLGTPRPPKPPV